MSYLLDGGPSLIMAKLKSGTRIYGTATVDGNLAVGGTVTANSDISLKENIKEIPDALNKTLSLRGVEYDRKDDGEHQIGVIAQEVEKVLPELVKNSDSGIKSVAYQNMIALLIEAIKEQNLIISSLSSRIDKIEFKEL